MKKLALLIASISLMTISCCNQDKQNTSDQNTEMTEEHVLVHVSGSSLVEWFTNTSIGDT